MKTALDDPVCIFLPANTHTLHANLLVLFGHQKSL